MSKIVINYNISARTSEVIYQILWFIHSSTSDIHLYSVTFLKLFIYLNQAWWMCTSFWLIFSVKYFLREQ